MDVLHIFKIVQVVSCKLELELELETFWFLLQRLKPLAHSPP